MSMFLKKGDMDFKEVERVLKAGMVSDEACADVDLKSEHRFVVS